MKVLQFIRDQHVHSSESFHADDDALQDIADKYSPRQKVRKLSRHIEFPIGISNFSLLCVHVVGISSFLRE
jgi:hypothetical protein